MTAGGIKDRLTQIMSTAVFAVQHRHYSTNSNWLVSYDHNSDSPKREAPTPANRRLAVLEVLRGVSSGGGRLSRLLGFGSVTPLKF